MIEELYYEFGLTIVDGATRAELLEFVESLRHEFENKLPYKTWQFCGGTNEWYPN